MRERKPFWFLLYLLFSLNFVYGGFDDSRFNFGRAFDGDGADYNGVDYITIWAGSDSPDYGVNFNPWWHGAMIDKANSLGATPVYYAYLIAFKARYELGLNDCDVSPSNSLCTQGAQFIRNNRSAIIQHYSNYAQATAQRLGANKSMIWMMEPDFMQYSVTGDALSPYSQQGGGIPDADMATLLSELIQAVKTHLPNAKFAFDISPWNNNIEAWLSHFKSLPIDYMYTSGGRTEAESERIRYDANNLVTWNQVSSYMGKKIIADCGYGVGGGGTGHDNDWDNVSNLNARIADGVLGVTQNEPKSGWSTTIANIRPQLNAIPGTSSSSSTPSSSSVSSSSSTPSSSSVVVSSSSLVSSSSTTPPPSSSSSWSGSDLNQKYGLPNAAPLASINSSYSYNAVEGNGGPDISTISSFVINWDLHNKGLYQLSINTTNGIPDWYKDLRANTSHTFGSGPAALTFSGTGFPGLDGSYNITATTDHFIMVAADGSYALHFSTTPVDLSSSSSTPSSSSVSSSSSVPSSSSSVPSSSSSSMASSSSTTPPSSSSSVPSSSSSDIIIEPGYGPVTYYGEMTTHSNRILGEKTNKEVQVKGMSLFWSNLGWGGNDFYNSKVVNALVDDWKVEVVRAAMGFRSERSYSGGYEQYPSQQEALVDTVVQAAIAKGIYVIIDFHTHYAHEYKQEAKTFFTSMAQKYGSYDNVIFEIYNEPLQISWTSTVKPYSVELIKTIRQYSDNLIVVGTTTWSQDVDAAAYNPITASDFASGNEHYANNIAYTLHFYAGTHSQSLRNKGNTALAQGIPLFATEWGTVNADGNGAVATSSSNAWISWMDQNSISWCNWSVNDKAEGASAFEPGQGEDGNGYTDMSKITASGEYVYNQLLAHAATAEWRTAGSSSSMVSSSSTTPSSSSSVPSSSSFSTPSSSSMPSSSSEPSSSSQGGGDYKDQFGVPMDDALASINSSYNYVRVQGSGPDLSNVTTFTLNWDLWNKGLYQLSFNTNDGNPNWYMDLRQNAEWDFHHAQPFINFSGTGISGFDGEYYVTGNADLFVLVAKDGSYAIEFSTTEFPAEVASATASQGSVELSESPVTSDTQIFWTNQASSSATLGIYDQWGNQLWTTNVTGSSGSVAWGASGITQSGNYIVALRYNGTNLASISATIY